jgi:hypothetical protein
MTEPEPVIREPAPAPPAEPTANGSNGSPPASEDPPLAAVAPPSAEPVMVAPPVSEPVIVAPPVSEPVFQMAAVSTYPSPSELPLEHAAPAKAAEVEALEDRLRRLETVLTNLADTRQLEERLAERMSKRVDQATPVATLATAPLATAATAPLATAAPATDQPPAKPNAIVEAGRRWWPFTFGGQASGPGSADSGRASASWLLFDLLREFQSILHMYGDPRYRLTWSGRILPVVFLALIATSSFWTYPLTGWMPALLGNLVLKTIDLVPAFCLFKVLSREARRYRETIPQYPHPSPPS